MRYKELVIDINRGETESVVNALTTAGFTSLVIDDPEDLRDIEEHPDWYKYDYIDDALGTNDCGRRPRITLYFSDDENGSQEASSVESVLRGLKEDGAEIDWVLEETADDSSWLYKWQENFKPTKVGGSFVVKPSWEEFEAKPEELVIEMDPGMAFGSGLHETTTLCIRALEDKIVTPLACGTGSGQLSGLKVLDVGTGTGILSIAAALLGAEKCLGIDIDADAVRVAKENVERNGLTGRIEIAEGDLMAGVDFETDIIVANLMADLVIRLAPAASDHLAQGGVFISSGILDIKEEAVADHVRAAGFDIVDVMHDGEWCAIVAERA